MVNRTLNIDSRLSELFCLSERLDFGAGQRGSDNRGWNLLSLKNSNHHYVLSTRLHDYMILTPGSIVYYK